jgi:alkylresorcinol/alkylpyrone synthase
MLSAAPAIVSIGTALPEHTVTAEQTRSYYGKVFELDPRRIEMMRLIVDNAQVNQRHLVFPLDYVVEPRPLSQISREYSEKALALAQQAASQALDAAGLQPQDIDWLITTSCTGFMIPSIDAHLCNLMPFRSDVRRLPITELGCAAGAASISLTEHLIRSRPGSKALIIAVELASLTFQRTDTSPAHLISCALFGDGAAACVVSGDPAAPGPRVLRSASHFFPHSLDAMGFDLRETGFHIILSKDVPALVRSEIGKLASAFLAPSGLTVADLQHFALHPGGQKLLSWVQEELQLTGGKTDPSWYALAEYGNLSSATVFFVLKRLLATRNPQPGDRGLLAAFGPGFTAEFSLLEWPA